MACWIRPCRRYLAFSSLLLAIDWALEWTSPRTRTSACGDVRRLWGVFGCLLILDLEFWACEADEPSFSSGTGVISTGAGPFGRVGPTGDWVKAAGGWAFGPRPGVWASASLTLWSRGGWTQSSASSNNRGCMCWCSRQSSRPLFLNSPLSDRLSGETWFGSWLWRVTFPTSSTCLVLATTNNPASVCLCEWWAASTRCWNPRELNTPRMS